MSLIIAKSTKAQDAEAEDVSLEELLKRNGLSNEEFNKMMHEMKSKGANAIHFMRGKDGHLVFKADGTTIVK